jgi:hypothetical protein
VKKYFKVDEWIPFVCAMEYSFLDSQERRKGLGKMRELKYKEGIESYLMDLETLNYKLCAVGTPWTTLCRDGFSDYLQNHLWTAK